MISNVSVERGGPVTILAINRPEKLNAINKQVALSASRSTPGGLTRSASPTGFVPDGPELDEAIAIANKIGDLVPLALATMKRFVTEHILPEGPSELAARFAAELSAVRNSKDAAEGVRAFEERRRPQYKGR